MALVTTELTPLAGHTPTSGQLAASAAILQRRIASFTGGKVVVTVRGERLEVRAEASATPALATLIGPGRLTFRRVIEAQGLTPLAPAQCCATQHSGDIYTPTSFAALECAGPRSESGGAPDVPNQEIVACDRTATEKFHLASAKVVATDVKGASAGTDMLGTQVDVIVTFTAKGQERFTNLTRETFGAIPPTNRIAIMLDGLVYSAPTIEAVINGDAQITGAFTKDEAEALADVIRFGPLPVAFSVSS